MSIRTLILALLIASTPAFSDDTKPPDVRVQEHKAKAEKMKEQDRAEIYSTICLDLAEVMNEQYGKGEQDKAEGTLKELVDYASKSATAAEEKEKKIKNAEINLRKCSRRLDEIRHTLSVIDQPPVKAAVDQIDKLRSDMLAKMFAPKKK